MTSRLLTSYAQSNAPPPGGGNGGGNGGNGGGGNGGSAAGSSSSATVTLSQQQPSGAVASTNSAKAATPPPGGAAPNGVSGGGNGKGHALAGGSSSSSSSASKAAADEQKRAGGNGNGNGSKSSSVHTSSTAGGSSSAAGSGSSSAAGSGSKAAGGDSKALAVAANASIPRDPSPYKTKTNARGEECVIIDVWAGNLKQELDRIMDIVDTYNHIAMDTEFPGVVARPLGCFKNAHDYHYQTLKCNVDLLKIIQLGLTFCNDQGQFLPGTCTWQFNFKFNLGEDMYAQDSIDMLTKSGIDFKEHDARGIDVEEFGELIMTSGIVLNEDVRWLSFHSGYDYGYLLKVLTCSLLPKEESDFFDLLRTYFPIVYDVKYLMKSCENLKGGLQKVAEDLQVERIGPQHQAGSDSLLTAATFFKIRSLFFENTIEDAKYAGVLYGLGQQLRSKKAAADSDELAA